MPAPFLAGAGRQPLLLLAAWASLVFLFAAVAVFGVTGDPGSQTVVYLILLAACALSFLSGSVGLLGIRANGLWLTLPPALIGMGMSLVFALSIMLLWGMKG
jgi:hypothetical protein